jgi:hypothetical protein
MSLNEVIEPTRERLSKGRFEAPSTDQKVDRRAWRQKTVADELGLSLDERSAFDRFVNDMELGTLTLAVIGGYGERVNGGNDKHVAMGRLAEKRAMAQKDAKAAAFAVRDPQAVKALCLAVDGRPVWEIGRDVLGFKCRKQATAAGRTIVASAIRTLSVHYGYVRIAEP